MSSKNKQGKHHKVRQARVPLNGCTDLETAAAVIRAHKANMDQGRSLQDMEEKKEAILNAASQYVLPYLLHKHGADPDQVRLGWDVMTDGSMFLVDNVNLFRPVGPDGGPEHVRRVWFALYLADGKWTTKFHPAVVEFHKGEVPNG